MGKRKYTKRNLQYWNSISGKGDSFNASQSKKGGVVSYDSIADTYAPETAGEPILESRATSTSGRGGSSPSTYTRQNEIYRGVRKNKFANIHEGLLPYERDASGVNAREAILLTYKAYCNISIVRNTIDMMAEFSNSPIYLTGGNAQSRKFINAWLKRIKIWRLKDQFFREFYRSGNVFIYRVDGRLSTEDFLKMQQIYGAQSTEIPISYTFLNPYDMVAEDTASYTQNVYAKLLSKYDLEKLRNPKTEEDKKIFDSLPQEVKKAIKNGNYLNDGYKLKIDMDKLSFAFYKKQDYEPFAIPMVYPVLDDLNWKLELKKIDQAISRTIENVVLLVTMGAEKEKGGINPANIQAMQSLLKNQSIGRYLVADYTTKMEFIIPDLKKVLGADKYEIVDKDIREGLQNIVLGSGSGGEKFSNQAIKTKIFLERTKEARETFTNDFMQPEINRLCKKMGFRKPPAVNFQEISLKDETQLQRIGVRLIELGILHPEQGIKFMKTGVLPEIEDMPNAQEKLNEERKKGYYNPIVGGVPLVESPSYDKETGDQLANPPKQTGRPEGTESPQTTKNIEQSQARYSQAAIKTVTLEIDKLQDYIESEIKASFNVKRLTKTKKDLAAKLKESIVCAKNEEEWKEEVKECLANFDRIDQLEVKPEILELAAEHNEELFPAAILYHSTKKEK